MKFLQFCRQIATPVIVEEPLDPNSTVSDDIKSRANVLCDIMKTKMDILDRIEIPFIEARFQDIDHVEDILEKYHNGDVPDYLLKLFSTNLYGQEFTSLNLDQQAIIKTLSVYICISNQG